MPSDPKQDEPANGVLNELSLCVQKHLGVADEDATIAGFVFNLYKGISGPHLVPTDHLSKFKQVLAENGGDDFPEEFIKECFTIASAVENNPASPQKIKKEDCPSLKQEVDPTPKIKPNYSEEEQHKPIKAEYPGLSIPNQPVIVKSESDNTKIPDSASNDMQLIIGSVYKGVVTSITSYGAFIRLNTSHSFQSGLCHISQISFDGRRRVNQVTDVLKFNQEVFVKVANIEKLPAGNRRNQKEKISLSMRGIDQATGLDKSEELRQIEYEARRGRDEKIVVDVQRGIKRKFTSPERWEIRQLIASGAVSAEDYPELMGQEDPNAAFEEESHQKDKHAELEIDIELNKDEPSFLKGQTQHSVELAPVKVFKNPEGSLSRSAMNGSKFSKQFKEEKIKERLEKEKQEKIENSKKKSSHDPLLGSSQDKKEPKIDVKTKEFISEWKKSQKVVSYGKRTDLPIKQQREALPVFAMRSELIKTIKENQFVVIVGETGSGKTTQIVQYITEEGMQTNANGESKLVGCTQPRRVAAQSVAKRVAEEVGCGLGEAVGYTVRFDDRTSSRTVIKYMTDGILQREALVDPYMRKYSVIMLDEAHERTIATDVLFALLKQAAMNNPDLKIIVTSATLDSSKFSNFFNSCPVLNIPGRTFPVEILYTKEPEMDYLQAALDSVIQIHISEPEGDILVFLTGQEEIDISCESLFERMKVLGDSVPELIILPVYSALPSEMQSRIFDPTPLGSRKVILATNIAETSITIDGIYYVIDPGFVKMNAYDAKVGMDSLMVSPISQAQARQRSGRAGRTGPGKCYRLYTEKAFKNEMLPNTIPEIQRQNLSYTLLMLKVMGINDLMSFDFMDPPPANTMLSALRDLYTLEALDSEGMLTRLGRKMADFPMQPALAKTLIASVEFRCSDEVLSIVAMLSVQTVFYRPKDKQNSADQRKARFHHPHGDHLTLLNVYRAWTLNDHGKQWCQDNFIQERSMRRAHEVRRQLVTIMRKYGHPIESCGAQLDRVRRALVAGFFKNSAKRDPQEGYRTVNEQTPVFLHPSSALFGKNPEYVLYHTLLLTTKEYMHCVTVIEPGWLAELAPSYFKVADPSRKKGGKIVPLQGKADWRLSAHHEVKRRALENM